MNMYNVILCDDDLEFLARLQNHVNNIFLGMDERAKVLAFSSLEEISEDTLEQCDIAILDIDFSDRQYNGIDIAKRLRKHRHDSVIIFLTNYIEYAPEGYEVQAFRYLLKSELSNKMKIYIEHAVKHLNRASETIKIQISGEIIDIPIQNIMYFESQLHSVVIHVVTPNSKKDRILTFIGSIGKIEKELSIRGFLRVHKSYLVNMAHIHKYTCHQVELDNGMILKASAARYSEQKEKYLLWEGGLLNGRNH